MSNPPKPSIPRIPPGCIVRVVILNPNGGSSVCGWGLVDTGATESCISMVVASQLGLSTIGAAVPTHLGSTTGGNVALPLYRATVSMPDLSHVNPVKRALGFSGIDKKGIDALIGQDILERCSFSYDGPGGRIFKIW